MPPKFKSFSWPILGWTLIAFISIGFILWFTKAAMLPFVLALFLYVLLSPLMDMLSIRFKLPKAVALVVLLLIVLIALTILGIVLMFSIQELLADASGFQDLILSYTHKIVTKLELWGVLIDRSTVIKAVRDFPLFQMVSQTAGEIINFFTVTTLVIIFTFFLLAGREPKKALSQMQRNMNAQVQRYVAAKLWTSVATGILVGIFLALLGVNYALMFGLLAFLLNFIPTIGSIVATLLPIPVVLMQAESGWVVFGTVALPTMVQMLVGNVIEPKVMGNLLDLHPVTTIITLIFWGILWGIPGMVLAVPMTAVLKLICDQYESTQAFSKILAGRFQFN